MPKRLPPNGVTRVQTAFPLRTHAYRLPEKRRMPKRKQREGTAKPFGYRPKERSANTWMNWYKTAVFQVSREWGKRGEVESRCAP
jgi:hypothetical protein